MAPREMQKGQPAVGAPASLLDHGRPSPVSAPAPPLGQSDRGIARGKSLPPSPHVSVREMEPSTTHRDRAAQRACQFPLVSRGAPTPPTRDHVLASSVTWNVTEVLSYTRRPSGNNSWTERARVNAWSRRAAGPRGPGRRHHQVDARHRSLPCRTGRFNSDDQWLYAGTWGIS